MYGQLHWLILMGYVLLDSYTTYTISKWKHAIGLSTLATVVSSFTIYMPGAFDVNNECWIFTIVGVVTPDENMEPVLPAAFKVVDLEASLRPR